MTVEDATVLLVPAVYAGSAVIVGTGGALVSIRMYSSMELAL